MIEFRNIHAPHHIFQMHYRVQQKPMRLPLQGPVPATAILWSFFINLLLTFLFIKQQQAHGRPLIAIYRRLVLSSYFYLLLLFVGQNRASKSLLHITPRIIRFLQFSTNKTFEGQLKPSKPFSYRSFSWLTLCGCQVRNKNFC